MATFRDLIVWQKSMSMVTEVYQLTRAFPRDETYGLTAQMRRCAVSIPSNIAEGSGRHSTNEYVRFVRIAMGSLFELQTQMEISLNLEFVTREGFEALYEVSREVERMLSSFAKSLSERRM